MSDSDNVPTVAPVLGPDPPANNSPTDAQAMFDFGLRLYLDEMAHAGHILDMDWQQAPVVCYWYPTTRDFERIRKESLKGWLDIPEVPHEVLRCIGCRQPPLKCVVARFSNTWGRE